LQTFESVCPNVHQRFLEAKVTILAVDDEPLIRTLLSTVLKENGFQVLTADCAAKAMEVFHDHSDDVDLLISDIVMPGMDGPTLATKLQTECPDLEVLLISGYCDRAQLSRGFEFLPKPFAITDMLMKVHTLLRNRSCRLRPRSRQARPALVSTAS
jgi:two-component system cell cycle sensor histidine kinase/response regulator CckA